MALGAIRRSRKKIMKAGYLTREFKVSVSVWRSPSAYRAVACVGKKKPTYYPLREPKRCSMWAHASTPTAATKKALHDLARRLK